MNRLLCAFVRRMWAGYRGLLGKVDDEVDEPLVIVPIPPLVALLQLLETAKGSPPPNRQFWISEGKPSA